MSRDTLMNELGSFLKTCRSGLTPRRAGLPESGGQRRVAGLRREEVAQLASQDAKPGGPTHDALCVLGAQVAEALG
ncbi:hypothetical protein SAMN02745244_02971 [Tessaracoccus bendigoensis DSM 12906]|uniref:Uncharacterized protein n=1 Tax=Tessaracoccus bendigoensis DSM 12906 TaxID=1123357 RepID=A0A1M6L2X4_9ACTN|nr:hypothetical protein [Tessaracoccus bendigoensis]SHJ65429.1 hypothetical protein SAMN02745244_02971 [Tessaracoccus bendigoensis DSM 12906]